jgi:hypothetical protein
MLVHHDFEVFIDRFLQKFSGIFRSEAAYATGIGLLQAIAYIVTGATRRMVMP